MSANQAAKRRKTGERKDDVAVMPPYEGHRPALEVFSDAFFCNRNALEIS
jgi:hypothetical protein